MSVLAIQLNHPGREKPFRLGKGYRQTPKGVIREWNNDATHYRKFLKTYGQYIQSPGEVSKSDIINFWGEWEGNSYFEPVSDVHTNGIHIPFHSMDLRGHQNTDPYVYGEAFRYAICKQRGRLTQLDPGSVILFGSSFKSGFALDTVFVVGSFQSAPAVHAENAARYSLTYRQATLESLADVYLTPNPNSSLRLYSGVSYTPDAGIFSFVPCRVGDAMTPDFRARCLFPYVGNDDVSFSSNPTGIKILGEGSSAVMDIWEKTLKYVQLKQYALGIQIDEPESILL